MPDPEDIFKGVDAQPVTEKDIFGGVDAEPVDDGGGQQGTIQLEPMEIKGRVPKEEESSGFMQYLDSLKSTGLGALHGVTSGYSDEAAAALDWAAGQVQAPFYEGDPRTYQEALERQREYLDEARQKHPVSFGAGDVAGGVVQGFAIPAARGASLAGRAGAAAAEGAAIGAVEGAGRGGGETAGEVLEDAAIGAGLGGVTGGALSAAGQGAAKGVKAAGRKARDVQAGLAKRAISGSSDEAQKAASDLLPSPPPEPPDPRTAGKKVADFVTGAPTPKDPRPRSQRIRDMLKGTPSLRDTAVQEAEEQGARMRRLAMEAEEPLDDEARSLASGITEQSRIDEQVREGGTRAIKRKPVAQGLREEVIPEDVAPDSGGLVEEAVEGAREVAEEAPRGQVMYHAGPSRIEGDVDRPLFLAGDPEEAAGYVQRQAGEGFLHRFDVTAENTADEDDILRVAEEVGEETDYVYDAIESKAVRDRLLEEGYDAARFRDLGPDNAYEHDTTVVLDPKKARVMDAAEIAEDTEVSDELFRGTQEGAKGTAITLRRTPADIQVEKVNQRVDDTVQDIRNTLDELEYQQEKERTPSGLTAIRRARKALDAFGDRVMPEDVEGDEAEALAQRYVQLDELKNRLGKFRDQADRARANPDPVVAEELESLYLNKLMPLLEDEKVWGPSASQMQKRVNRAWKPFLDVAKTREWRRLHKELDTPSPTDPFGKLREADPRDTEQLLRDAGTAKGDVPMRILRGGLERGQELNEAMAEVFPLSEAKRELVRQGRANVDTLMRALDDREVRAEAADQLRALERAGGETLKVGPLEFPTPPGKYARKLAGREMAERKGRKTLPRADIALTGAGAGAGYLGAEDEEPADDAAEGAAKGLGVAGALRAGRGLTRASQVIRRQLTREAGKRGDQAIEAGMPEDVDARANVKTLRQLMQEKPQLFGNALADMKEAAQKGSAALAAEHQEQQETNPEYRRRVRRMLEETRQ